ncbi:MAG TPA: hypothetical protein VFC90_04490, partial [Planctomycetota bacterium]|nr:hypothetical protein [Planctomycetota bacterium]
AVRLITSRNPDLQESGLGFFRGRGATDDQDGLIRQYQSALWSTLSTAPEELKPVVVARLAGFDQARSAEVASEWLRQTSFPEWQRVSILNTIIEEVQIHGYPSTGHQIYEALARSASSDPSTEVRDRAYFACWLFLLNQKKNNVGWAITSAQALIQGAQKDASSHVQVWEKRLIESIREWESPDERPH